MSPRIRDELSGLTVDGKSVVRGSARVNGELKDLLGVGASAIPDSEADQKLVHRWLLDDDSPFRDSVGDADGTNNGTTQVSGDYAGGAAREGDGTDDYISIPNEDISPFIDAADEDLAVAITIDIESVPSDRQDPIGVLRDDGAGWFLVSIGRNTLGKLSFSIEDDNGDRIRRDTSEDIPTGKTRVVLNKTGNSAGDIEIWFDQSEESTNVVENDGLTTGVHVDPDMTFFQRSDDDQFFGGVLDDICFFGDALTDDEIESYENPWE